MQIFPRLSLRFSAIFGRTFISPNRNFSRSDLTRETGRSASHRARAFDNYFPKNMGFNFSMTLLKTLFWLSIAGIWTATMIYFFQKLILENYR